MAVIISVVLTHAADAQAPPAASQPARESFSERYGVIADRNIFLRDRARPRDRTKETPTTRPDEPAPLTPEQAYVLRGIVLEEGDLRAYFEDRRSGEVTRIATGAMLAAGRVAEIQIDSVRFQNEAALSTWVEIGSDLTGTLPSAATASGPTTSAAPPPTPTDPALLSVEERMRLRRQQRGGGR